MSSWHYFGSPPFMIERVWQIEIIESKLVVQDAFGINMNF